MDRKSKKSCLVIGGGGLIGASLAPRLAGDGRTVTVLGRSKVPSHPLPDAITYISGDFGDKNLIKRLVDEHDDVIHLAYATVPNTSFDDPLADLLENLPPTVQLFSEVAARGKRLVLVTSGGTVYGEAQSLPISEDHPTRPISPYGVTKRTLEKYAHLYAVTHGLQVICVRPANAYGEGQRPFTGQGFISTAMASIMRDQPVKIFGKSGATRDYIYVSDVADGLKAVLDRGLVGETYNLGTGVGRTNHDVIEAISRIMEEVGHVVKVEYAPERAFDVRVNVLDSTKLNKHTGWRPRVEFTEGLKRTHEWLRKVGS